MSSATWTTFWFVAESLGLMLSHLVIRLLPFRGLYDDAEDIRPRLANS
jgi:hypothetical protein